MAKNGKTGLQFSLDGSVLTLKIDFSKNIGPSKSGKTTLIASSHGNVPLKEILPDSIKLPKELADRDIRLGMNCFEK